MSASRTSRLGPVSKLSPRAQRLISLALLCAGMTALWGALQNDSDSWVHEVERFSEDWRLRQGRLAEWDPRLCFVAIDQPTYQDLYSAEERRRDPALRLASENWPWSREVWALAIERLIEGGARVVALDLIFANEGVGDDRLSEVVRKHAGKVVLAADVAVTEGDRGSQTKLLLPSASVLPAGAVHPLADRRVGLIKQYPDLPGMVVRRTRYERDPEALELAPDAPSESFSLRILHQAGLEPRTPSGAGVLHRFRYSERAGPRRLPQVPLHQILHTPTWGSNYVAKDFFRDKLVVIGPGADIFHDEHRTPFGENMLGPMVHLNVLNAALKNQFLQEATPLTGLLLTVWAGITAWLLSWGFSKLLTRFLVACAALLAYAGLVFLLYNSIDLFIPLLAPAVTLSSCTLLGLVWDFSLAWREKTQLRRTLERYVSKDVVRELLDNPQTYLNSLVGVRKPVAILFSDVRGFTSMTEGMNAADLVKQLNEYFQVMVDIVVRNRGRLDKFIGDAVMADWGSFVTGGVRVDCERTVRSALEMRLALRELNDRWVLDGFQPLAIGIGVNLGDVIVGNLGSEVKMEVSVIGDAVNLASRLEGLTKEYQLDLLLGETVAEQVKGAFVLRSVDLVQVKGKTKPVAVFTIPPDAGEGASSPEWLRLHEEGIRLYRAREFQAAAEVFGRAQALNPKDDLLRIYIDRCAQLLAAPPGPEWSGVYQMTRK